MNMLLLGATGRVGRHILTHAIRSHHVTALVRNPDNLPINNPHVSVIKGNALNKDDIFQSMRGIDVVVSALNTDGTNTLSESMPLIIEAMKKENITRIITVGTAGILQSRTSPDMLRYQSRESRRRSTKAAEEHHKVYELLDQSLLDWTIVCPTYLPDGDKKGEYRIERNFLPEDGVEISVADTADFVYSQVNSREYNRMRVGIAY